MKKYSTEYFEKKFKILYNKLVIKEGFVDEVKKARKELGIPIENGFVDSLELAQFLFKKLKTGEKATAMLLAHMGKYEEEKKSTFLELTEKDKEEFFDRFMKEKDSKESIFLTLFHIIKVIEDHSLIFTNSFIIKQFNKNKFFTKLFPSVAKIANKYWGVDLLDDEIAIHYFEKYLFLGDKGVNSYIQNRLKCPHCQYIGVMHFSPERNNMQGQDKGAFSKGYVFNKGAVEMLSQHFNSVFLIIKPYATKEQVIQYLKDNWDDLKEHMIKKNVFYKQNGVHSSIKESDFDRNQLVYYLYKLSKKELAEQYKELEKELLVPQYKESIISKILEKKYNLKMSPDAIKRSATRFAKSIKIHKEPKDIRDI